MTTINLYNLDELESKHKNDFDKILTENIINFHNLLDRKEKYFDNMDWYLSLPYSKNTLISNLYKKFCLIILCKKILLSSNNIKEIIVENNSEKIILKQFIKKDIKIIVIKDENFLYKIKNIIKLIIFFTHQLFYRTAQLIIAKITKTKNTININKKITLIDTYAIPGFYSKDRYYNNRLDLDLDNFFFLPTIAYTKIINFYKVYKELRLSKRRFLIKEDYLNIFDILTAIFFIFRVRKMTFNNFFFRNINFSPLILDDIISLDGDNLSIEGYINYIFIKKLKIKKYKLNLFIDWWENQATDKGFHLGLSKYYPNVNSIGYLGYVPRKLEIQLSPSYYEFKKSIVPKNIAVIGNAVSKKINIYASDIKVVLSPAFRYEYLWTINKKFNQSNFLISLPIAEIESLKIIQSVINFSYSNIAKELSFFIKPHPTMSIDTLRNLLKFDLPLNFFLTDDKIDILLSNADFVASSMSIVCLEAISLGIPTFVYLKNENINHNPIPNDINEFLWKKFKNHNDLLDNYVFFVSRDQKTKEQHIKICNEIKLNYFEPFSKKGINDLTLNKIPFNDL